MDDTDDSFTCPTRLRALSGVNRVEVRVLSGALKALQMRGFLGDGPLELFLVITAVIPKILRAS
jgi:hypothetical protein